MTVFQAFVLGILQGLAEFLPISSSAHLALAPWAFGWEDPGLSFDVALHIGTLVALLWYFRAEWVKLARAAVAVVGHGGRAETVEERRRGLLESADRLRRTLSDDDWRVMDQARMRDLR